jgi:hypothetical protein
VHPYVATYPVALDLSPIEMSSGTSMCPAASYLVFLSRWASVCHVSSGPKPHLLAELSSGAVTCCLAPEPHIPVEVGSGTDTWLRASPPY